MATLLDNQPLSNVYWVSRDKLKPREADERRGSDPRMLAGIKVALMEFGWNLPIVCYKNGVIIAGYDRWLVSGEDEVYFLTNGVVPVVFIHEPDYSKNKGKVKKK